MFINTFSNFINTFAKKEKITFAILTLSSTIAGLLEFAGLALIYLFVLYLTDKSALNLNIFINVDEKNITLLIGILIAVIYVLKDLFMIAHIKIQSRFLFKLAGKIFNDFYLKFISQENEDEIKNSDKIKILNKSIVDACWGFCAKTIMLFSNIIIAILILAYLFIKFKFQAAGIALLVGAIWFVENKYFKKQAKKYGELLHNSQKIRADYTLKTINSTKEVIIYNKEKLFLKKADEIEKSALNWERNVLTNEIMPVYFTEIGIMIALAIFIIYLLSNSTLSGAQLSATLASYATVILRITPVINRTQSCLYSIRAFKFETNWLIETYKKFKNKQTNINEICFDSDIVFSNVNFSYPQEKFSLNNINFKIKKGDFIGIVGLSGCGKTTLFNLICGFLKPQSGEIFIDGNKLDENNLKSWQNKIAILTQDFSLPFSKMEENIAFEPDFDNKSEINNIIKILDELELNEEFKNNKNTQDLSLGQKHRIALARTLYFDRKIIMLDEATSSLDVVNEENIVQKIENLKGKKTIIAIAHRLKTLKNCTKIIYMKEGKIADIGTLEELEMKFRDFHKLIELSKF